MKYSIETKIKELKREIYFRNKVYPKSVARGTMTQDEAERRIAIMEDILHDYYERQAHATPTLDL